MPTKSNMPMQTKIGEASLKFGPDWLRALSSSESTPSSSHGLGGGGERDHHRDRMHSVGSGWGPSSNNSNNSKDFSNAQQSSSASYSSSRGFGGDKSRFKQPEFRYSREEMLALYDKNLETPSYLLNFGTLHIEKMQPPLAFSQPSEDEIRIWHIPQPESSRQGPGGGPPAAIGRGGFALRGRGGPMDRGRGRGRGGFYSVGRGSHEDEASGFSRPRNFERSQSNHERTSWSERNGIGGAPGLGAPSEDRGGSWRNRESFGGRRGGHEENDDGWRKPRWRRDTDEGEGDSYGSRRRVHRSWSEDDNNHDNLPEWARDNPSEESGTFDSSGAFYGDKKQLEMLEKERGGGISNSSSNEPSSGSQLDRVQKRVSTSSSSSSYDTHPKPVIPPSLKEEPASEAERRHHNSAPQHPSASGGGIHSSPNSIMNTTNRHGNQEQPEQQFMKQHQQQHDQKMSNEENHYRSMTEEAMNLVSKLIEEENSGSGRRVSSMLAGLSLSQQQQQLIVDQLQQHHQQQQQLQQQQQQQVAVPPVAVVQPPAVSPPVMDVWYYRDPQGNVQGPFSNNEMALWYSQGYFSGTLQLRRECDKTFITLAEMGKLYGRIPFVSSSDRAPPPAPIQPEFSALTDIQAQLRQQQLLQQQQQQQQLREQQYMMRDGWAQQGGADGARPVPTTPLTPEHMQTQLLMNMAKSQGLERGEVDQLQALFSHQQATQPKPAFDHQPDIPSATKPASADPLQSLVHQLTSMKNTQQTRQKTNSGDVINAWSQPQKPQQPPQQWGTSIPPQTPWEYREQMAKLQQDEQMRRKHDEEKRLLEEEERKQRQLEEQQRLEEERKRFEEQQRLAQLAEEDKRRKIREEQYLLQQKQQAELLRKQQEAEAIELQKQKELQQRQELERQRQLRDEQTRLAEEQQRKEREREAAELKMRQEQQLKLQQQQFSWNAQGGGSVQQQGKSLLEIQQEEAIKQEIEAKKKQQEQVRLQQQQAQQQQQKAINLKWAQNPGTAPGKPPIKSFTEIQAEEQAKLQRQQEVEREKRAQIQQQNQQQAAWNAQLTWANRASSVQGSNSTKKVNGGVWEDTSSMASKLKGSSNNVTSKAPSSTTPVSTPSSARSKTGKDAEDSFMKLFNVQGQDDKGKQQPKTSSSSPPPAQDDFTRWCFDRVGVIARTHKVDVDIPVFVAFLKEVESPFEVNDYVKAYLGDEKDAKEFSKEFVERRSRWRNSRKDGNEDNLCQPASAVNPNSNEFQEVKGKGKKQKKGKMQKVAPGILGFSTSAAADRLNRDYGDSTD